MIDSTVITRSACDEVIHGAASGSMDCFASLAMTWKHACPFSRRIFARVMRILLLVPQRGSRECRVRAAPAVSCACLRKKIAHEHTGERRTLRHPLRNGFTAYIALSPVSGLVVTVTHGLLRKLEASIAASGPHDFAVRGRRLVSVPPASTASHPNVWWRWPTPLLGDEVARLIILIFGNWKRNIFAARG
jgi:hypothetical protein